MLIGMDWTNLSLLLGGLAFVVAMITEFTKKLGFLKRVPTDLQALALGVVGGITALFCWADLQGRSISWGMLIGATVAGVLAAFIAMYGWATFYDLLARFCQNPGERNKHGNVNNYRTECTQFWIVEERWREEMEAKILTVKDLTRREDVPVLAVNIDGSNFVRLRDVEKLFPVTIGWDGANPTLRKTSRTFWKW